MAGDVLARHKRSEENEPVSYLSMMYSENLILPLTSSP